MLIFHNLYFFKLIMEHQSVKDRMKGKVEIQKMWRLPMELGNPFFGYYFGGAYLYADAHRNLQGINE